MLVVGDSENTPGDSQNHTFVGMTFTCDSSRCQHRTDKGTYLRDRMHGYNYH